MADSCCSDAKKAVELASRGERTNVEKIIQTDFDVVFDPKELFWYMKRLEECKS